MNKKIFFNLNLLKKILKGYREKNLSSILFRQLKKFLYQLQYIIYNPAGKLIRLHCPEYINPDKKELRDVERIFVSFKKMKEEQANAAGHYLPSSLWQETLDRNYSYLNSGIKENNIDKFHYFLANFGIWEEYLGVESNTFIKDHMNSFIKRRYLKNGVFYNQLKIWRWFYNNRKPISQLNYPRYGNQPGAYINGTFVGIGSFFNEIYGSILSDITCGIERPIIAELGAGYGKLAYFILRNKGKFTFIDFDLPETLCLAAYYLMKVYPGKKVLLYGEEEYAPGAHKEYDLIFMPSYEIEKIGESSINLFLNKNSLGEMTKEAARNYITHILKATKRYFFHMNHEITPNIYNNNEQGLLGYEYPVPEDEFTLLFRYPDMGHMLYQGFIDFNTDIFIYLYERKNHSISMNCNELNTRVK